MNTCGGRLPPTGGSLLEVPTRFSGYDSISYATRSTLQSELLLYLQCPQNSPTGLSNPRSDRASASQRDIGASRDEPGGRPLASPTRGTVAVFGAWQGSPCGLEDPTACGATLRRTRRPLVLSLALHHTGVTCYFVSTFIPAKTTEIVGYNRGVSMHVTATRPVSPRSA